MKRRISIERLNGRLKAFRKLDAARVRGRRKVRIHALHAIIIVQARALAFPAEARQCVEPL
jgi:hypothetical protein